MATIYLKAGGTPSSPYASWTDAADKMSVALGVDAAGDTLYLASTHTESEGASKSFVFAGLPENPMRVLSVTEASPPTTLTAGAVIATTGAFSVSLSGSAYIYGITFQAGSSSSTGNFNIGADENTNLYIENCLFQLANTSASSLCSLGNTLNSQDVNVVLKDCVFRFGSTGQKFGCSRDGRVLIQGGSVSSAGSAITTLCIAGKSLSLTFDSVDLSACATGVVLVSGGMTVSNGQITFRNCKLPASWSGSVCDSTFGTASGKIDMYNCAAGDTNYEMWLERFSGSVKTDITAYRTGGWEAAGSTPASWQMATNANANYPSGFLESPEIQKWNETVGSAVTVTVEVAQTDAAAALNQEDCWLEVVYLGTTGFPLGLVINDAPSDIFAAAGTDQTSSSETWTGPGWSSPVTQKLSVSITPREVGFIQAKVKLAKASTTVYVCPKMTVA